MSNVTSKSVSFRIDNARNVLPSHWDGGEIVFSKDHVSNVDCSSQNFFNVLDDDVTDDSVFKYDNVLMLIIVWEILLILT